MRCWYQQGPTTHPWVLIYIWMLILLLPSSHLIFESGFSDKVWPSWTFLLLTPNCRAVGGVWVNEWGSEAAIFFQPRVKNNCSIVWRQSRYCWKLDMNGELILPAEWVLLWTPHNPSTREVRSPISLFLSLLQAGELGGGRNGGMKTSLTSEDTFLWLYQNLAPLLSPSEKWALI